MELILRLEAIYRKIAKEKKKNCKKKKKKKKKKPSK